MYIPLKICHNEFDLQNRESFGYIFGNGLYLGTFNHPNAKECHIMTDRFSYFKNVTRIEDFSIL